MDIASIHSRAIVALALVIALGGCSSVPTIDTSSASPISNDDTYATLSYLWVGVRTAIEARREPSTDTFNLPLSYQFPCTRGGQGAYQGTLAGTKSGGTGNGTLSLTGTVTACALDDNVKITTISASGLTVTGTIAITSDTWGAMSINIVAPTITVNGTNCPGGANVMLTGTTPFQQPISTGTICGRTGAVALP
jgi:uncharacterized protein YceK